MHGPTNLVYEGVHFSRPAISLSVYSCQTDWFECRWCNRSRRSVENGISRYRVRRSEVKIRSDIVYDTYDAFDSETVEGNELCGPMFPVALIYSRLAS